MDSVVSTKATFCAYIYVCTYLLSSFVNASIFNVDDVDCSVSPQLTDTLFLFLCLFRIHRHLQRVLHHRRQEGVHFSRTRALHLLVAGR